MYTQDILQITATYLAWYILMKRIATARITPATISIIPLGSDHLLYWYFIMYFLLSFIQSDFQVPCSPEWPQKWPLLMGATQMEQQLFSNFQKIEIIQEGFQEGKALWPPTVGWIHPIYLKPMQGFLELSHKSGSLLNKSRPQLKLVCDTSLAGDHNTPSQQLQ